MKAKLTLSIGASLFAFAALPANAATTLALWTFEDSVPDNAGPHAAESGFFASTSLATGGTGGTYSNPAGNGSTESFSSNGWDAGDYYQFTTSTTGYSGITLTFDHTGSNTGPQTFLVQYSTNGITYTTGTTYTVTNDSWNPSSTASASTKSFDFSSITELDDAGIIYFRLTVAADSTAINGSAIAAAGTSRVDNVSIVASIPEPATALLGAFGALGLLRRRR